MKSVAATLTFVLGSLWFCAGSAWADPMDSRESFNFYGEVELEAGLDAPGGSNNTEVVDTVTSLDAQGDQPRWLILPVPGTTEDPTYPSGYAWCRDVEYVNAETLPPGEEQTRIAQFTTAFVVEFARVADSQGWPNEIRDDPCPLDDMEGLPAAIVEAAVRDAVIEQVPRPEPRIPPGYALTGLPAYLVTEHELSFGPLSETLDFGITTAAVTLSGSAVSTVDWGDGTTAQYETPGLPYPDGEVAHTYTHRGAVTVQIVDTWDVSYDVADGALTGTIQATLDPVTIDAFDVREYRAVRKSSDP